MSRTRYRTVFISDTHLGSRGAQAATLSHFLKRIDCERLYLVGDIIDFWRLKAKIYWPWQHNAVLRRILKLLKRGTQVVLVPGNHDEVLRQYTGIDFGGIVIRRDVVHECADGQRMLVTHGDQFDMVVTKQRLLSLLGAAAYDWLIVINRFYNRYRTWRGKPYWSLSQCLKLKVKSACTYVSRFQDMLMQEAKQREVDGVICGHIHKPEIVDGPIQYLNCGDWVESCTALVEHFDGRIELIHARDLLAGYGEDDLRPEELLEGFEEPIGLGVLDGRPPEPELAILKR
jgi:UDP-2,3-diacylglucosamine pyrophosphatase LpxH